MKAKIKHEMETITPAKAEKYLNQNKSNRTLRTGVAEKYESEMRAGAWTQCVAPIVFYEDGDVADGQHRLWAVVAAGIPQDFIVVRGLKREDGLNIDTGLGRTLVDNARISGRDEGLSHMLIAVCKSVELGDKTWGANSNSERLAFVDKHRDAGTWAIAYGPKGVQLRSAVVLAAIARAWYHEQDKDRLAQFGRIMTSGFPDGEKDFAAAAMRTYLLTPGNTLRTTATWRPTFLKVQNAIYYFMRGKALKVVKGLDEERYPLKGKQQAKPAKKESKLRVMVTAKKQRDAKIASLDKFELARRG